MSVVHRLERIREILVKLSERSDCVDITGFNGVALRIFVEGLDRAIQRYEHEAARVRKYAK